MASRKTIIIASAIICLLLLTILYMDYRIRTLEGKTGEIVTADANAGDTGQNNVTDSVVVGIDAADKNETKTADTKNETAEADTKAAEKKEPVNVNIGTLKVVSYPAGAVVYIDDKKVGTAPYNNFSMPVGNYTVKLLKSGYGDYCKKAYVYKGKVEEIKGLMSNTSIGCSSSSSTSTTTTTNDEEEEEEEATTTGMKFTSEPSGAEVKLNGQSKGTTPVTVTLTEGTSLLKISKSGYKTYSAFVNINSEGRMTSVDESSEQNGNNTKIEDWEWEFSIAK
ncbi:MAG: PEGA domain-containing protein [Candidatus Woesearchaeota archaeon]